MNYKMIDHIERLIKEKYRDFITSSVDLTDADSGMKVTVEQSANPSNSGIVVRIPANSKAHPDIIEENPGYRKSCDFIIFIPDKNHLEVYFIELKKSLHNKVVRNKAFCQILSTVPVLEYLISKIRIHHGEQLKTTMHFAIIAEKLSNRLDKQPVKPGRYKPIKFMHGQNEFRVVHSLSKIDLSWLK